MIKAGDLKELLDVIPNDENVQVLLHGDSEDGDLLEIDDVGYFHQAGIHVIHIHREED